MKVNLLKPPRVGKRPVCRHHHRERGSTVLIVLVLLSVMLIYVNANLKLLSQLQSELKLIEKRQIEKFASPSPVSLSTTNVIRRPFVAKNPAKLLTPTNAIGAEPEITTK